MTYHYNGYSATIRAVRDPDSHKTLYWKYEIYDEDTLLLDGHDVDSQAARITVEAHIDWLVADLRRLTA
jgi:replication-associated recombination protein RarA